MIGDTFEAKSKDTACCYYQMDDLNVSVERSKRIVVPGATRTESVRES